MRDAWKGFMEAAGMLRGVDERDAEDLEDLEGCVEGCGVWG